MCVLRFTVITAITVMTTIAVSLTLSSGAVPWKSVIEVTLRKLSPKGKSHLNCVDLCAYVLYTLQLIAALATMHICSVVSSCDVGYDVCIVCVCVRYHKDPGDVCEGGFSPTGKRVTLAETCTVGDKSLVKKEMHIDSPVDEVRINN